MSAILPAPPEGRADSFHTTPDVALISASYPPRVCGIGDYTARLTEALREEGIAAGVWTGQEETAAVPGRVHPIVSDWASAGVRALAEDLIRARPRLVHLQYERAIYEPESAICLLLPRLLRRAGIPLITTFHALDGPRVWGRAHRAALLPLMLGSRNIVICSQRQLSALQRLPGGIGAKTSLIPVGNLIPVTHQRVPDSVRRPGPLRLVYFGFVWRGRNIDLLLRALRAVLDDGRDAILEILGSERDPEYRTNLDQMAERLGLTPHVRFRGEQPAPVLSEALAKADLVLLPFETGVSTGRSTLMAALAHAAPIVTLGVPENLSPLFRDGENLRITPAADPDAFIAAVREYAADSALRARLSAGTVSLAESFTWAEIARRHLALPTYREAVLPR